MRRGELDVLVEWAAGEGWNPGLDDAQVFWETDPDGFIAMEVDGELGGGGSIVSYGGVYGFMGFFIVRPDLRGSGLGRQLWYERRRLLLERLDEGAPIEMDGVFDMQAFYAEGGFVEHHRDLRFEGIAEIPDSSLVLRAVIDLRDIPFEMVDGYDRVHFAGPRSRFLRGWIDRPGGTAVGVVEGDRLVGFAIARPARTGHRIGPLFADAPDVAAALFGAVCARLEGETVYPDVPECNEDALALVRRHGMVEVFGCGRMTLGEPPALPWDQIYGVTSLELG